MVPQSKPVNTQGRHSPRSNRAAAARAPRARPDRRPQWPASETAPGGWCSQTRPGSATPSAFRGGCDRRHRRSAWRRRGAVRPACQRRPRPAQTRRQTWWALRATTPACKAMVSLNKLYYLQSLLLKSIKTLSPPHPVESGRTPSSMRALRPAGVAAIGPDAVTAVSHPRIASIAREREG